MSDFSLVCLRLAGDAGDDSDGDDDDNDGDGGPHHLPKLHPPLSAHAHQQETIDWRTKTLPPHFPHV